MPDAPGGTLSTLELLPGFYRSSATSTDIRECFHEDACSGGDAVGSYCAEGYGGPCKFVSRENMKKKNDSPGTIDWKKDDSSCNDSSREPVVQARKLLLRNLSEEVGGLWMILVPQRECFRTRA